MNLREDFESEHELIRQSKHLGKVLNGRKSWNEEQIIKHLKGKVNYEEKVFSKC